MSHRKEHSPISTLSPTARLNKVREGLLAGKALRQMARELKCDEGTIRRDVKKLQLGTEELALIEKGKAAAEPYLRAVRKKKKADEVRAKAQTQARERHQKLDAERRSGVLSNELCKSILEFLGMFTLLPQDNVPILRRAEMRSWYEGDLREPGRYPDHQVAMAATSPMNVGKESVDVINAVEHWLYKWVTAAEPSKVIRDKALTTARQHFEKHCPWPV